MKKSDWMAKQKAALARAGFKVKAGGKTVAKKKAGKKKAPEKMTGGKGTGKKGSVKLKNPFGKGKANAKKAGRRIVKAAGGSSAGGAEG